MKYSDGSNIAEKLRKLREANALSHQQIADALHIHRTTYTKYESGKSEPSLTTLVKIAKILNVTPEYLLPDEGKEHKNEDTMSDVSFVDSPIYQLSKEERSLIAYFRVLSREQKKEIVESIAKITKNGQD